MRFQVFWRLICVNVQPLNLKNPCGDVLFGLPAPEVPVSKSCLLAETYVPCEPSQHPPTADDINLALP